VRGNRSAILRIALRTALLTIAGFVFSGDTVAEELMTRGKPVAALLDPDGTLNMNTGYSGTLDLSGYRIETGPEGEPVFVPIDDATADSHTGNPNDHWDDGFRGRAGVNGTVMTSAVIGSGLYVGGLFFTAGGLPVSNIAKWDGENWSDVGGGLTKTSGTSVVYRLHVSGSDLYVGGVFDHAGDVAASNVARWDGESWSAFGSGISGSVEDLVTIGPDLFVVGSVNAAGNVAMPGHVAKWNGSAWSALGAGCDFSPKEAEVFEGDLYVAGSFNSCGGLATPGIARWDGAAWSKVGDGLAGANLFAVTALAVFENELYVAGKFTSAGGDPSSGLAIWDGEDWTSIPGTTSTILSFVGWNGDLYAAGGFATIGSVPASRVARWDGVAWSALGAGVTALDGHYAQTVSVVGDQLFVGGDFNFAGGLPVRNIGAWDGAEWSRLGVSGLGSVGPVYAIAKQGDDFFVGGDFPSIGETVAKSIAKLSGDLWSPLGNTDAGAGDFLSFAVIGSDLYAGGTWSTLLGFGTQEFNGIAKWNGASWSPLGTGFPAPRRIEALAVIGTDLYAAGNFSMAGGLPASRVARWNGSAWSALGTGMNSPSSVNALAVMGTTLYAGGTFTEAGGMPASRIAKWNGSTWAALGTGMDNTVSALAVSGSDLYAGGTFTMAGGVAAARIAKWNGTSWSALGEGIGAAAASVNALAVDGTDLYAAGSFTTAGGQPAASIAKWNGASWSPLGNGLRTLATAVVDSLLVDGTSLYATGNFIFAGEMEALHIARWDIQAAAGGVCGDNQIDAEEECDDGDTDWVSGEFCNASCEAVACGDVNDSGTVTTSDALLALRASVGSFACSELVCDANGNGSVTSSDALLLLRTAVGQSVTLNCG
jgi:trimeric autotransporter adhesin